VRGFRVATSIAAILTVSAAWSITGEPVPDEVVWGVKSQSPGAGPPSHLFRFAVDGSEFVDLGPISIGGSHDVVIDALAIDAFGTMYAFQLIGGGSRLVRIDDVTQDAVVATVVGALLADHHVQGAVIDGNGDLIALDVAVGEILTIDLSDGSIVGTPIPMLQECSPFGAASAADLAQASDGTYIVTLSIDFDLPRFYRLDRSSGRLTLLHEDGEPDDGVSTFLGGMAFADAGPGMIFAYDINYDDDIFAYDVANGFARTELYQDIIPQFNAGRGDLAAMVTVTGTPPSFADLDGDGAVTVSDLLIVLGAWGPCTGCAADLDCSGAVDVEDLLLLLGAWG
jgi:hypothetical protein